MTDRDKSDKDNLYGLISVERAFIFAAAFWAMAGNGQEGLMKNFFNKKNVLGIGIAFALLVVGFVMLGLKPANNPIALNVAPFVLVLTYLVVIPFSIWTSKDKDEATEKGV